MTDRSKRIAARTVAAWLAESPHPIAAQARASLERHIETAVAAGSAKALPSPEWALRQIVVRTAEACGVRPGDIEAGYYTKTASCELRVCVDLGSRVEIVEVSAETFDGAAERAVAEVLRLRAGALNQVDAGAEPATESGTP